MSWFACASHQIAMFCAAGTQCCLSVLACLCGSFVAQTRREQSQAEHGTCLELVFYVCGSCCTHDTAAAFFILQPERHVDAGQAKILLRHAV